MFSKWFKYLKRTVLAIVLILLCSAETSAQIDINRFNFSVDYENFDTDWLSQNDRTMFALGSEFHLNEVFSVEAYYRRDLNGWQAYSHPYFGASVYGLNPAYKWGHMGQDLYIGMRVYPLDQWHSTALELRKKYNTGFYVSMGRGIYNYKYRGFRMEVYQSAIVDSITGIPNYTTDSAYVHRTAFNINQWGPQFGFGWKQYHTRFIYTDLAIYANAYFRDNRSVTGWYINDPDDTSPPYNDEEYELALKHVETWARNGHGFLFKASIGINLDFRR